MSKPSDLNLPPSIQKNQTDYNCTVDITVDEKTVATGYGFITRQVTKTVTYEEAVLVYAAVGLAEVPVLCRGNWWDIEFSRSNGTEQQRPEVKQDCYYTFLEEQYTESFSGFDTLEYVEKTVTWKEAVLIGKVSLGDVPEECREAWWYSQSGLNTVSGLLEQGGTMSNLGAPGQAGAGSVEIAPEAPTISDVVLVEQQAPSTSTVIPLEEAQTPEGLVLTNEQLLQPQEFELICDGEKKLINYCSNFVKVPKTMSVDWRTLDRTAPYFQEKNNRYYLSFDIVAENLSQVKNTIESNKQTVLDIILSTFNLVLNTKASFDVQQIVRYEDVYYESRDMKPSKILYSIKSKDLFEITGTEPDAFDILAESLAGTQQQSLTVVKKQTFKVRDFFLATRIMAGNLNKYAVNYELWLFATGNRSKPLIESAVSSGRVAPKVNINTLSQDLKRWNKIPNIFTVLLGKNGIPFQTLISPRNENIDSDLIITYSKTDPLDANEVPIITNIKFQSISRPATDLVWYYGDDPLGGFNQEESIVDDTARNYLFLLDELWKQVENIKWKDFIGTYRNPRIELIEEEGINPVVGKGLTILKDFSSEAFERVLSDLEESEFKFSKFAEKYNKQYPNLKSVNQKIKQDQDLENIAEKLARGALVDQSYVDSGDPLASLIDTTIARGFAYYRDSKDTDLKERILKGEKVPPAKFILDKFGLNFAKFAGLLAISVVARQIPLEKLDELNIREKLKLIDPINLLEKALEDAYEKVKQATADSEQLNKAINFINKVVNGILNSPAFDPRLIAAFDQYIKDNQPEIPEGLLGDSGGSVAVGSTGTPAPQNLLANPSEVRQAINNSVNNRNATTPTVEMPPFAPDLQESVQTAMNELGGDLENRSEIFSEAAKIMCGPDYVRVDGKKPFWYVPHQSTTNTTRGYSKKTENQDGCPIGTYKIYEGSATYDTWVTQDLTTVYAPAGGGIVIRSDTPALSSSPGSTIPPESDSTTTEPSVLPAAASAIVDDGIRPPTISSIYMGFGLVDFLKSGQANIKLDLISRNLEGEVIGTLSLDELPNTLVSKYDEVRGDLDYLFDKLENCELPDPEVFEKYKEYAITIKEFFKGFKKISKKKGKKKKIPDLKEPLMQIFSAFLVNLYYVAVTAMLRVIFTLIRQLTLNLSCSQFSVLLSQELNENTFTPRNPVPGEGLEPLQGNGLISKVADALHSLNPTSARLDESQVVTILSDISSVVGFYDGDGNPEDISQLEEFFFQLSSLLNQRELCSLFAGTPTPDAMTITQNLIKLRFSDLNLSTDEEDIKKLFGSMGSLTGPLCYEVNSPAYQSSVTMPVNTVLCTKPTDYQNFISTRRSLLSYKNQDGQISEEEINAQLDQVCNISKQTIDELITFYLAENPLDAYYDQVDEPFTLCGRGEVVPGMISKMIEQIEPIYDNVVSSLDMIFLEETAGGNGLLNNILINKSGFSYPGYLALQSIYSNVDPALNPFAVTEPNPSYIATWMRENLSVLGSAEGSRIYSIPLAANSTDLTYLTSEEIEAYRVVLNLKPNVASSHPSYRQLFEIVSNPLSGLRTISYCAPSNKRKNVLVDSMVTDPPTRVENLNFFIIPHNGALDNTYSSLTTTIIDYKPFSVTLDNSCSVNLLNPLAASFNASSYLTSVSKKYDIVTISKDEKDYRAPIYDNPSILYPTINIDQDKTQLSNQSIIFADVILNALSKSGKNISSLTSDFISYLNKDYYNLVFNSFLDGILKIPSLNEKNLSYGITDRKVNLLNSRHVNTLTAAPAPVKPESFGGTEEQPVAYFYNALEDTLINLYNLIVNDSDSRFPPVKKEIPDISGLTKNMTNVFVYLPEDDRTATDLSNQTPFDLIIPRSSFATSQGVIEASMMVFAYETYVKGFSLFNTMEPTNCNFDNTIFRFMAEKYKEVIKSSTPEKLQNSREIYEETRMSDKEIFYHQFLEIFVNGIIKRRDANIINLSEEQSSILEQIERKINIWELGIPSTELTLDESVYLNASQEIAKLETVNYPIGPMNSNMVAGVSGPALSALQNRVEEKRLLQVKRRNYYWSLIMKDCESLCLDLIGHSLREKFVDISYKMQILNPKFTRLNDSLYTPFVGGPSVQSNKNKTDNNIFQISPTFLTSRGNIPEINNDYGKEQDYNFNGFMLLQSNTIINDGAKEVVMPIDTSPFVGSVNPLDFRSIPRFNMANKMANDFLQRTTKVKFDILNLSLNSKANSSTVGNEQAYKVYDSELGSNTLVYSQNRVPFIIEQYVRLEPFTDPTDSKYPDIAEILYEYLYYDFASDLADSFRNVCSLKNIIEYIKELGFFEDSRIDQNALKNVPFNEMFAKSKVGLRLTCVLPDAGLTLQQKTLSSIIPQLTDEEISSLRNGEKLFFEQTGYSVPLFSNENDVSGILTFDEISKMSQSVEYYNKFFRANNLKNINSIVASDTYKLFFDYCVPLRYFNSLAAIYTVKSFIGSIGTYYDTQGKIVNLSKNSGVNSISDVTAYPEYHNTIANYIDECYHSYNLLNNLGSNLSLEFEPIKNRKSHIVKTIKSKVKDPCDADVAKVTEDLRNDLLSFNNLTPEEKTKLFNDIFSGTPSEFSNYDSIIKDPTNNCGFASPGCSLLTPEE
jgi:hypothetical protein